MARVGLMIVSSDSGTRIVRKRERCIFEILNRGRKEAGE